MPESKIMIDLRSFLTLSLNGLIEVVSQSKRSVNKQ